MPIAAAVPAIIGGVGAVGSALIGKSASDKAIQAQKDAAAAGKVDIEALNNQTKALAQQNAVDSAALEAQLTPEISQLRRTAPASLLNFLNQGQDPGVAKGQALLTQGLGVPLNTPLLNAAIAKAQSDLGLGGRLSQDLQNAAVRRGAAAAGTAAGPGGGLGLGRDLSARDLGLTSYQVEQQRLQNASQLGGQELNLAQSNQSNLLNSINMLRAIHDTGFNQSLAASGFINSVAQPNIGLNPGTAASLAVGNSNLAAQSLANQGNINAGYTNSLSGLLGQGLGYGLQAWNAYSGGGAPGTAFNPNMPGYDNSANGAYNDMVKAMGPCWVAREVFGADNPEWTEFRDTMRTYMDKDFIDFYTEHGPEIAHEISRHDDVKQFIAGLMRHITKTHAQ